MVISVITDSSNGYGKMAMFTAKPQNLEQENKKVKKVFIYSGRMATGLNYQHSAG